MEVLYVASNSSRYFSVAFSVIAAALIQRSRYARCIDGIQDMTLASIEEPLRTLKQHLTSCVK